MTDDELKALVASVAEQQKETDRQVRTLSERMDRRHDETERHLQAVFERMDRRHDETERHLQAVSERMDRRHDETERHLQAVSERMEQSREETDRRLQTMSERMEQSREETDRRLQTMSERMEQSREETDRRLQTMSERMERSREETDRHLQEVSERIGLSREETDRQLRDVNRQVGGLSNKFGSFTGGLAYRSCKRILREHFRMEQTLHEVEVERPNGQNEEYDMLGVANGRHNEVVVVEIKSQLRERDLEQTLDKLRRVPEFMPQYKNMKIHGMIAAVYLPKGMQEKVEAAGLYLATGADENFTLLPPSPGFQPKPFGG